ncbi:DUF4221 family protein [Roseivirga echinicomitans]|uniref:DUF4221 domain-containing protein n=1 Tax=Roseivirga echinicomitans TaxID=296218 RepID=A0A150XDC1_9BACT|nr:DUF4221 family protein [Roseivirga echinicomitans]KYG76713.1 hypothetical protein AWN68_06715 [Roseivirga echinicomitans]
MKNHIFSFLLLIGLASCSGNNNAEQLNSINNSVSFEKIGEKILEIDSLSDYRLFFAQPYNKDKENLLLSFAFNSKTILVFDYGTGKTIERISFPNDGPNNIAGTIVGFQAFSSDSLMITTNLGHLYVSNFNSEITKFIDLDPESIPGAPSFRANSFPAHLKNDKLLLDNYFIANKGRPMKISVDLKSDSVEYFQEIPEEHIEGYWAAGSFGYSTSTINTKTNEFVYNFPGLDSLYIWNSDFTQLRKEYAGTSLFEHPIEAIFTMGIMPTPREIEQKPLTRGIYGHIFYDDTKDLYYRIIGLPISQTLLDSDDEIKSKTRRYAVMVLNSDFEILGEFKLPEYEYIINTEMTFFANGGIHFQKESTNEDEALIDIWSAVQ